MGFGQFLIWQKLEGPALYAEQFKVVGSKNLKTPGDAYSGSCKFGGCERGLQVCWSSCKLESFTIRGE